MPLWQIYHPETAFNDDDKLEIARKATALYEKFLPRFYVNVMFVTFAGVDLLHRRGASQRLRTGDDRPYRRADEGRRAADHVPGCGLQAAHPLYRRSRPQVGDAHRRDALRALDDTRPEATRARIACR